MTIKLQRQVSTPSPYRQTMFIVQRLIASVRLCGDMHKSLEGMRLFASLGQRMTQTA
jgi:hypothetical protein